MRSMQSGFTLIELVMVIVILGILAAFALPKFADLSGDAERAAIDGAIGAVKSASGITRAAYLAGGSTATTLTLEGTAVALAFGYPSCAAIVAAAALDGFDTTTSTCAGTPAVRTISSGGCSFTYTEAADAATPPVVSANSC